MKNQDYLFYQNVGQRIRSERIKQGLSQAELADKASLSLPVISTIENGRSTMWLITFAKIALALQVDPNDLLVLKTPASNTSSTNELEKIFDGCTPSERESIIKVLKEARNIIDLKNSDE